MLRSSPIPPSSAQVQVDFLQAKLSEEQARRQRAEERARVLKNYSEKAKVGRWNQLMSLRQSVPMYMIAFFVLIGSWLPFLYMLSTVLWCATLPT